jgi:hypothetical protein
MIIVLLVAVPVVLVDEVLLVLEVVEVVDVVPVDAVVLVVEVLAVLAVVEVLAVLAVVEVLAVLAVVEVLAVEAVELVLAVVAVVLVVEVVVVGVLVSSFLHDTIKEKEQSVTRAVVNNECFMIVIVCCKHPEPVFSAQYVIYRILQKQKRPPQGSLYMML